MTESKQQIIITGVNGFVGEHLARHLHESNFSVHGIGREEYPGDNVAPFLDSYQTADLLDSAQVRGLMLKNAVAIIHLAGLASVAESFDKPDLYKTGNAAMTNNLFESAAAQGFTGRVVAISTGALYDPSQPMPINEASNTIESSPYAIGKLKAEEVTKQHIARGIDAVIIRPFNHIGPGQGKGFLVGDLYDQLEKAHIEGSSEILVGNLATKRDYTDVRDIVRAYLLLAIAPTLQHDTYNIASGKSYSGFEILDYLKSAMKLESIIPIIDPSRVRPTDATDIVGDTSRLKDELGWETTSSVATAIHDFVARRQNG